MNILKKLTIVKDKNKEQNNHQNNNIEDENKIKQTYYNDGYETAISVNGDPTTLKISLKRVFEEYKEKARREKERQEELKRPYKEKLKKQEAEKKKRETAIDIKKENIERINENIDKLDFEIADVKNRPEKYGIDVDKKSKVHFYIGILILLPLTLYLFVFYISASFSAFFKQFTDDDLMAAVFDGHAFSKAMQQGILEAIFVGTIPFVFMGLGYLIHMFQKQKKAGVYKIIGLLGVTFIFDALLAYQIEKKIYNFEKTLTSPEFDFQIAFTKPEFWTIIFAGFIVYIIWGLVFDFIMKEHQEFDKINSFIRSHKENKRNLIDKKEKINQKIDEIKHEIAEIDGVINELNSKIDGFIFEEKRYLLLHNEYFKGWLVAIGERIALAPNVKNDLRKECLRISNEHLESLGINDDSYENLIYTK
ncbi:MAG: ABC transporter permease [Chlorobi bacterium]|nr:ABC transporter permease [Chlorobiota bacterium]